MRQCLCYFGGWGQCSWQLEGPPQEPCKEGGPTEAGFVAAAAPAESGGRVLS